MATSTVENYLKAIRRLQEPTGTATVGEIARELEVTPGTVTTMMRHLSDEGMIDYAPRRGLRLLPRGEKAALQVVRRHRLIELFLVEVMGLDWSEVHEEAELLEHVVSDRLLERIDLMLGYPTHDPHGDPIPDRKGRIARFDALPLSGVGPGLYRVVRVSDADSDLLEWLDDKGLGLSGEFELTRRDLVAGLVELRRESEQVFQLGLQAAESIFVERV